MTADSESRFSESSQGLSRSAITGLYLAISAAVLAMLAGLGSRWGWWQFRIGFIMMLVALLDGLTAIVLSIIGIISTRPGATRRGFAYAILGLLVSIGVISLPLSLIIQGFRLPPIHDITTDTDP